MEGFYETDLAAAHSASFSELSLAGGSVVLDALLDSGISQGAIVDLGCGSGEWTALASSRGFEVTGVDVSTAMLELARARVPSARFVRSSLWEYELPSPLVAVTALGEALNYGTPALPSIHAFSALAERVARVLVSGGVFVFDLLVGGEPMRYRSWVERDGRAVLVEVDEDTASSALTRSIVVFTEQSGSYRRTAERHLVRVYDLADVERAISQAGLSHTLSEAYGDRELGPRRVACIARKR
jgi:SAM-dependent methyltransferase